MPSTATTSVTIGTILDLIGPTVHTSSGNKDEPPFDALLQPTPRPAPSTATTEERRLPPRERQQDQSLESTDSRPPESSPALNPLPEEPTVQTEATDQSESIATEEAQSREETTADQEQPHRDVLVAESLAAIAVVAPVANAILEDVEQAAEADLATEEPLDAASKAGAQKRGRPRPTQAPFGKSDQWVDSAPEELQAEAAALSESEQASAATAEPNPELPVLTVIADSHNQA
jgi:hypothetical protein